MDIKESTLTSLRRVIQIVTSDLQALPESAFSDSMGSVTRNAADIIFEVNMVNDHVCMGLRGEEPFEWPEGGWIRAPEAFRSKAATLAAFEESAARTLMTVEAITPEEMVAPFEVEGSETTRYSRSQFMLLHMWYHSGQLNYIQTLLGDEEWHW